ncbi:MAG: BatA domain-containing protein, partial [Vicinamibacterales bacterium]
MTWLAPWALVGLVAVAAPVLVHWLARHQATRMRFPTIQFLVRSSPVSVRRYRLRDLPLLAVRVGIIAAAVIALAQPVWVRRGAPAARPARAIVLDTSASMERPLADGRVGGEVARQTAAAESAGAATPTAPGPPNVTVRTDRISEGVAQAAAWLRTQRAPRELVVISDFQVGTLVESDLDTVLEDAAVRLLPIVVSGPVPAKLAPDRGRLRVLAGTADAARAAAAEAAARATEKTSGVFSNEKDTRRLFDVVVLFASVPAWDEQRRSAPPVDTAELFEWVADIKRELRRRGADPEKTSGVFFAKKTPDV